MGSGNSWPAVDLAKVLFNQSGGREFTSRQVVVGGSTDAAGLHQPNGIFRAQVPGAHAAAATMSAAQTNATARRACRCPRAIAGASSLASPTSPSTIPSRSAMRKSTSTEGSSPDRKNPAPDQLEQFDPSHTTVCLPLGPGQTPVTETWELVQLSTENHNFHIHQTRFAMTGSNGGVLQDNFPLGVAAPDHSISDQVVQQPERRLHYRAMAQRPLRIAAESLRHPVRGARGVRLPLPHPRT